MSKYVDEVIICEVGPRDGLQAEKTIVSTEDKVELINAIVEAGVPVVEVGSFMHPVKMPQMANTDEVFKRIVQKEGVEYRALIPNARGVERAAACGCKKVKLNVSASRAHNLANLNRTPEESVAGFKAAVDAAKDAGIAISGSISMPFGSPWEKEIPLSDVKSITQAYIDTGITEISLSDTAGVAYPSQVYNYCVEMAKEFPQVTWWMHFHNTRGLAIANIVAAMEAGFTRFDSSFAGAGGCPFVPGAAGNVSTEDVVHMMDQMGIKTGIDLDKMIAIGKRVGEILNHDSSSYILKAGPASALIRELPTGQAKANNAK
ncbi:MAG: hydroxymethylglutaryl-CoA lyase [Subdoligranulum sp.]|nr:hydroxymethylglutaryl-CoA lyase [Subdoligranulum sp.]MDD7265581.1 hydroxymethylglutaryl-CoA lyase [Subdoligranulum sp.]MDY5923592.1 hydroxymethylglutaryl-CoA lyase [Oscillospiraceae bacterium]